MKQPLLSDYLFILLISTFFSNCQSEPTPPNENLPNIIYILADDLGYGELGSYQQTLIETPHLDALAASGMRFTRHYSGSPVCAPARCILLTGSHAGNAWIRGNDEWRARGEVWNYEAMFRDSTLEGQRPIPDSIQTIAELLKTKGYATGMVGKWGLGAPATEGLPNLQGFDYFLGYNCQRQAHTLYPLHLWHNDQRKLLNNPSVAPNTKLAEGADPEDPASYTNFELTDYAPTVMHEGALQFIEEHKATPFFLYYASSSTTRPFTSTAKMGGILSEEIRHGITLFRQ